jgi:hypothetical protein
VSLHPVSSRSKTTTTAIFLGKEVLKKIAGPRYSDFFAYGFDREEIPGFSSTAGAYMAESELICIISKAEDLAKLVGRAMRSSSMERHLVLWKPFS